MRNYHKRKITEENIPTKEEVIAFWGKDSQRIECKICHFPFGTDKKKHHFVCGSCDRRKRSKKCQK
jgi:hypothetical protein